MEMRKGVLIVLEDGRERFLKYTLNSLRILEKDYGVKLDKLDKDFSLEMVQALLHVGLLKDDPEITFEEVGDLVDMGNINMVTTKLTEALGGLQKPKA
mgnify:CR=1 FL=1|jgi:hypothetical protein